MTETFIQSFAKQLPERPSMKQDRHPEHNMPTPDHNGFESTIAVGDYQMPRADYEEKK